MRHHIPPYTVFGILPPHMLSSLAQHGDEEQRKLALQTLGHDHSMRTMRMAHALLTNKNIPAHALYHANSQVSRTIYNGHNTTQLPGDIVRTERGDPIDDDAANEAFNGLGWTHALYQKIYQRNSIDDAGMPMNATVHYGRNYTNAFWNGEQMVFGDGDGKIFNRFTISIDVIGHELTYGVTEDEAKLVYMGQSGALNESISDVFGSLVKQYSLKQTAEEADWLIGHGLFTAKVKGEALRSMKNPGAAYDDPILGKDPQPATMDGFVHTVDDNGGVHINSGIPNHAFYLVATAIGGNAWEQAGRIWYETLRDAHLRSNAGFRAFARLTEINAERLYGAGSKELLAVRHAWGQVGVTAAVPAKENAYVRSGAD